MKKTKKKATAKKPNARKRTQRCTKCGKRGFNSRTCPKHES